MGNLSYIGLHSPKTESLAELTLGLNGDFVSSQRKLPRELKEKKTSSETLGEINDVIAMAEPS